MLKTIQNNLKNGHKWTEEELDLIRVEYKGTNKSAELIARRLSIITGENITTYAVKKQAAKNGYTKKQYKQWDDKELDYFTELVGKHSLKDIQCKMRKRGFKRTLKALDFRLHLLNMQASERIGWYTKEDAAGILGVGRITLQKWIDSKALKATWHHGVEPIKGCGKAYWHIDEADLLDFALNHSMELTGRNINFFLISDMFKARLNQKKQAVTLYKTYRAEIYR